MSELYVMSVPVVSTAHLLPATYHKLAFNVGFGEHAGALSYGGDTLWVYILEVDGMEPECPPDLRALFEWARKHGYDWIRLDGEIGDVVPGLPTYTKEWEAN